MKFIISRASGSGTDKSAEIRHKGIMWDDEHSVWTIEVNTVQEMVDLLEHYDHPVVVGFTDYWGEITGKAREEYPYHLVVYDDYLD